MQNVTKIMVAVDLSDYSLPSVKYACELAEVTGAKMILVNVYNQRDINAIKTSTDAYYDAGFFEKVMEDNKIHRRNQMDQLVEKSGAQNLVIQKMIRVGVPYQELMTVIEEEKPDLLVMGTKGRSNLADTIIGSCARKMFRKSPIPMLSLPPNWTSRME